MTVLQLVEQSPAAQVAAIEKGLPAASCANSCAAGRSQKALLDALGLAPRTITHRLNKNQPSPRPNPSVCYG